MYTFSRTRLTTRWCVYLRRVGVDPRQVGAGAGVHGRAAGQTVAGRLEDERGDTSDVVAWTSGAVDWATAITVASSTRVSGVVDTDVIGPDGCSGTLGRALSGGQDTDIGLLENVREGVGGGSSAPSCDNASRSSEVVVVVGW